MQQMHQKFDNLKKYLSRLAKSGVCLAYSGGIDSTLLLYLCSKEKNFAALTFYSLFQTEDEIIQAQKICKKYNVKHLILKTDIFQNPKIISNPKERCYYCKKMLFENAIKAACKLNLKYIIDGTNFDDMSTFRPGKKALSELNIISPFVKFEITKNEIREYSKENNIETFNKPSSPCLATRFPYGTTLTKELLEKANSGEKILKKYGFLSCRFRIHGDIARIEIPKDRFSEFLSQKECLTRELKTEGIKYITLDIEGLRSGSMDL